MRNKCEFRVTWVTEKDLFEERLVNNCTFEIKQKGTWIVWTIEDSLFGKPGYVRK